MDCPRIVIAGATSGVGKTSLSLALVTSLRRQGLRVQTFKVGPDYLDPTHLALASERPCYNLDGWMTSREYVGELFARVAADADFAVIEGVMGLFDGADPVTSEGSTAEIARWLEAPVLLVVDASAVARSLAAMVKGYADFEPDIRLAGVIANRCGSERHGAWLADALQASSLPPLVGAVPREAFPALPSRHLGLVTADHETLSPTVLRKLADALERHGRLEAIVKAARKAPALPSPRSISTPQASPPRRLALGLAYDRAFHFYYPDNLDALAAQGCEVIRFSPLEDEDLPEGLDGLYIGGGYPEEYAKALADNRGMLEAIRRFAAAGRPIYAECGGLMYLAEGIETLDGKRHPLVGLLPAWTRMLDRLKALGYVEVTLTEDSLWGPRGARLRGHEYHYAELIGDPTADGRWRPAYALRRHRSEAATVEGFQQEGILASFVHTHFASRPESVAHFVASCEAMSR